MLLTLIGKNIMYQTTLPEVAIGNYWISDKVNEIEKKILNVEGINGKWQITSSNYVKVINPKWLSAYSKNHVEEQSYSKIMKNVTLKEYEMYYIAIGLKEEIYILYCEPRYEKDFKQLEIKNTSQILIGSGTNNHISYENALVKNKHAAIFLSGGRWIIENYDTQYGTFVNNVAVGKERKVILNGDIIYIMGLKIIIMGKKLFINNPLNKMKYDSKYFSISKIENNIRKLKVENEDDIELYSDRDYFSRAPRITNVIEKEKVKIESPPTMESREKMPLIFLVGTTLSMGIMMMMSSTTSIRGLITGDASYVEIILEMIMAMVMLFGMIMIPILQVRYEKKQKKSNEQLRQKKYREYLTSKINVIDKIMDKQRKILLDNYLTPEECAEIILNKNPRLWERKIDNRDFLKIRVGIGEIPLDIDIEYPEKQFSLEDDELVDILDDIANNSKTLTNAPITISLAEKMVSALVVQNNEKIIEKFMQRIIMQLITFHSYEDLKLVFLVKEDKQEKWEYVKMLPHLWNNTKQIRFFADNYTDMKEIAKYLEEELKSRTQYKEEVDYRLFSPYYLIITDDYKRIEGLKAITEILKSKKNLGFSMLCITDNLIQLPNECNTFISLEGETGTIFESEMTSTNQRQFKFDVSQTFFFEKIIRRIANIPIKYTSKGKYLLPNSYTFLEMYDVGKIEQLNILERWKKNDSTLSLSTLIGIDSSGMPISLDVHEKFHGPHGLIAGSTGSGKSEFIITYILSLAINYHPDDVNFILIDYKGGGLAGAFQKREIKLPHLVGTITNIDTNNLQRSLASIQSELRRRQVKFNETRNMIDEGTIDIYKYQKLYHSGIVSEPIPHLLIICDEFAELKQQQEDFMDELISVARIGRSLGVHLILATQKPAGIVNDQIRSNSKFGICLKVQDTADSIDVIKCPDATYLKKAGQFYMQVGNDEYFTLGLSAWAGAPYYPSDIVKKKVDSSIEFINNIGVTYKEAENSNSVKSKMNGEQLTNIVKYLYELAKQENIVTNQLWIDSLPENIYLKNLKKKYHVKKEKDVINPVIGEYDDPYNQRQGIVQLNLSKDGNTIIFGNAESGKETLLSTLIYDIITTYKTDETEAYILDFGSEALKIFKSSPHVGDVLFVNETEKINRFFNIIQKEISYRKNILSEYNGDYNLYLKTSNKPMPTMIVILNNYEAFSEIYEDEYEDIFQTLTREGPKYGIVFIITTSTYNDIRYRLSQNFKQKIVLQLNNDDDYFSIYDGIGKKRPSHIFGRGLIKLEDIYEFQVAKICEPDKWNNYIKETINEINQTNQEAAITIPVLPSKVTIEDVKEEIKSIEEIPIGISKNKLNIFTYNFKRDFVNIISSKNIEVATEFALHVIEEIKRLKNIDIVILDAERIIHTSKNTLSINYQNLLSKILQNSNTNTKNHTICIIIGIDKFINNLDEGDEEFQRLLRNTHDLDTYSFIVVDNVTRLKNHEFEDWYKEYISSEDGIWVGNGINDQYLINLSGIDKECPNNCGNSFGYSIRQGNPVLIKLVGMKDKGDENE